MSIPLEHDYIGLSEPPSMERSSDKISSSSSSSSSCTISTNLMKETELRLGLPGYGSKDLEDKSSSVYSHGPLKNFVLGAKRGFSDAIHDGCGKWGFAVSGGSEADLGKSSVLYSSLGSGKGGLESNSSQKSCLALPAKPLTEEKKTSLSNENGSSPAAKGQVVGWPPIRSFRKSTMATNQSKNSGLEGSNSGSGCIYVKVSMDGAPFLRKVDLRTYGNYPEFSSALEKMFSCFTLGQCTPHGLPGQEGLSESRLKDLLHGSEYVLTYEDKDGDWMLVGDVPWAMFIDSCKRLRIMKGSEAIGLAPRAMEKCKNRN